MGVLSELAVLFQLARRHAGVAIYFSLVAKPFLLGFPGSHDALANGSGSFLSTLARDVAVFDGRHFDVEIDAIEQRAGDALTIALHLHRAAAAFAFKIAEVAAREGIHCGNKHELGRKCAAP